MRRREQVAVVGVLALDQPGGQPRAPRLEHGIACTEADLQLVGAAEHPLQLVQRPARHEHLLALPQHLAVGQVADREPVGVGGDHAHAVGLGREQHAGQHRPGVVGAGGAHHLAEGVGDVGRRERDGLGGRLALDRVVVETERADGELRPTGADAAPRLPPSSASATSTAPAGSERTMSATSRAGTTTAPSRSPPTGMVRRIDSSRSVPVTESSSPLTSRRSPDSTGSVPVRLVAARPAVARASPRTSRSHRNFTVRPFPHRGDGWMS